MKLLKGIWVSNLYDHIKSIRLELNILWVLDKIRDNKNKSRQNIKGRRKMETRMSLSIVILRRKIPKVHHLKDGTEVGKILKAKALTGKK
jgi:hypothetical protein